MLSGQGLVRRITGSFEPPLSAHRMFSPSIVRNCGSMAAVGEDVMTTPLSFLRCVCGIVARFDGLHAVVERFHQAALADASEDDPEEPSPQVLALSDHDVVDVGRSVRLSGEGIRVAGPAAP